MPLQPAAQLLRTPLFIVSLSVLATLLLCASIFQRQQTNLVAQSNNYYGNALARLAASQATDATLNHDLVSLQVTVRDVASNPHVLSTTIHDVENQLLVESGNSHAARGLMDSHDYRAPITFQDSIAGYVTVTLDTRAALEQQDDAWLIGIVGLCVALLALSLLNLRRQSESGADSGAQATGAPEDNSTTPSLPGRAATYEGAIGVCLKLRCLNLEKLEQQLSSSLLQKLLKQLERLLSGVNTIYSGRIHHASKHSIDLHFHGDDLDKTALRAICAALLLFQLIDNSEGGVKLHYAAAVYPLQRAAGLRQQIEFWQLQQECEKILQALPQASLLLHAEDCATTAVTQRLQIDAPDPDAVWLAVKGLRPAYASLLEKQAAQLQQL